MTLDTERPSGAAAALCTTAAVRERSYFLLQRARAGESPWFAVDDGQLSTAAAVVSKITLRRYPDLLIPVHSRWRHFEVGGVDRKGELDARLETLDRRSRARAMIDLVVVSVLLDAGGGPDWGYREGPSSPRLERSEGLAVASWHAFMAGMFSSDTANPMRVDSAGLQRLSIDQLATQFQVGPGNALVGLDGRVLLMHRLGEALSAAPETFGSEGRPGGLFDAIVTATTASVSAHDILTLLLTSLSGIWPSDNMIGDQRVGDCWPHTAVPGAGLTKGWMPFHKLSQWLTYSLLEPFGWAGVTVDGIDDLTGLPEYRNGGLLLDTGVLRLRNPAWASQVWSPADELVVEWRALTVALLDELAPLVRAELDVGDDEMPLACVLEGGTWAAGRELAQHLRGGAPPLAVRSDGTVF